MQGKTKFILIASVATALIGGTAFANHDKGDKPRDARADQRFERMDADQDGKVTLSEMKEAAIKRFSRRDVDGDGIVSREDRKAMRENRRAARFDKIDADGDGMISRDEFAAFKPERGMRGERRGGRRGMRGAGRHHRGEGRGNRMGRFAPLTIQEVEARAERRFERLDVDDKGYFTLEDLKARGGKRRGRR